MTKMVQWMAENSYNFFYLVRQLVLFSNTNLLQNIFIFAFSYLPIQAFNTAIWACWIISSVLRIPSILAHGTFLIQSWTCNIKSGLMMNVWSLVLLTTYINSTNCKFHICLLSSIFWGTQWNTTDDDSLCEAWKRLLTNILRLLRKY